MHFYVSPEHDALCGCEIVQLCLCCMTPGCSFGIPHYLQCVWTPGCASVFYCELHAQGVVPHLDTTYGVLPIITDGDGKSAGGAAKAAQKLDAKISSPPNSWHSPTEDDLQLAPSLSQAQLRQNEVTVPGLFHRMRLAIHALLAWGRCGLA